MGFIICRRCGLSYDRVVWDECPHCARKETGRFSPLYNPTIRRMDSMKQDYIEARRLR